MLTQNVEKQLDIFSIEASSVEATGMAQGKFFTLANKEEKTMARKDQYTAKISMFIMVEGFNVRDNGHRNGVCPDKARRYANCYLNGDELPPLVVERVIIDGKPRLKVIDGHNRLTGGQIASSESGTEYVLPYTVSKAKSEAEQIIEMLNTGDSLALTQIDKGNGYKRLANCGWEESRVAEYFSVTTKEVKDCIRLSELPQHIKQAIRNGEIAWTRVLKLYDTYVTATEAESAIELEVEGGKQANEQAAKSGDTTKRNRHNNMFRKKNIGKKLVCELSQTVNSIGNHIAETLGFDSIDSLPTEGNVNVTIPVEMLAKLLAASDQVVNIENHNEQIEAAIAARKAEKASQTKAA